MESVEDRLKTYLAHLVRWKEGAEEDARESRGEPNHNMHKGIAHGYDVAEFKLRELFGDIL